MSVGASGMTANEQKQQLSIAYVHAVAARAGYACQPTVVDDDSVDLRLAARGTVHKLAVRRSPLIEIQLKAAARPVPEDGFVGFPLPIKNYNDLRLDATLPRILVVLLLPEDENLWLVQSEDEMITRRCAYWMNLLGMPESSNRTSVTVRLPREQRFTVASVRSMMEKISRKETL